MHVRGLLAWLAAGLAATALGPPAIAQDNAAGLGVYVGNSSERLEQFEAWMGCRVGQIHAVTGDANWLDYTASAPWTANIWRNVDRPVLWSVPLFIVGGDLRSAAAGRYDDYYREVAETLAQTRSGEIIVRTGWEFNGDWFAWSAIGKEQDYIGAFRRFVEVFRAVSPQFRFEWNVNIGERAMDPAGAYPGDAFVDYIGMDFYYNTAWHSPDPEEAWRYMLNEPYGLAWHRQFAAAHRKPMAYSEWGVMSENAGPFIERVSDWFRANHVAYANFWNSSDEKFAGLMSDGSKGEAGRVFQRRFGGGAGDGDAKDCGF
jgi:Glycosyl hydrolase family 26